MYAATKALLWEIWQRNRRCAWLVAALLLAVGALNVFSQPQALATETQRDRLVLLNSILLVAALLLVLSAFHYTESNPRKDWAGFPCRLFTLPIPTAQLVALPMLLAVVTMEVVYWVWLEIIPEGSVSRPAWLAVVIGVYTVFYQLIMWTLAGFRTLRLIVLGVAGTSVISVAFLPSFATYTPSIYFSERPLMVALVAAALIAFVLAWACVARQRRGGGTHRQWFAPLAWRLLDAIPRWRTGFASASHAQFWFEWRRSGMLLPLAVSALLILLILPISWFLRHDAAGTIWTLAWTLAMPIILAGPLGKGFSKPDFWSRDLAFPPFVAVRPLTSGDFVVIKLKVAALSTATAWFCVLVFLALWLPRWANLEALTLLRLGYWMAYDHSTLPEHVIAALLFFAAICLTWKLMVGGLWLGLSGNRQLFVGLAAPYCVAPVAALIALGIVANNDFSIAPWMRLHGNSFLAVCTWLVAGAVVVKLWLAARFWRRISPRLSCIYLLMWSTGSMLLVVLAVLLWAKGLLALSLMSLLETPPFDVMRLRNLLILLALLLIPYARLGLAPASLARNRSGGSSQ